MRSGSRAGGYLRTAGLRAQVRDRQIPSFRWARGVGEAGAPANPSLHPSAAEKLRTGSLGAGASGAPAPNRTGAARGALQEAAGGKSSVAEPAGYGCDLFGPDSASAGA
mmetsp:Transcript_22815/g.71631  ORF Transcript_22815/g.71631 Transcript_22815/m.71631 type:complete len:109 (-) Transcript_22815:1284-1610(-)